jgi:hypothetical protein
MILRFLSRFVERARYRVTQFAANLFPNLDPLLLETARSMLSPDRRQIFDQLALAEKAHTLRLFVRIKNDPTIPEAWRAELLELALCHDFGKTLTRPRLWEKVIKALLPIPNRAHPILGARILWRLGAPKKLVKRVARHHAHPGDDAVLACFQKLDDSC